MRTSDTPNLKDILQNNCLVFQKCQWRKGQRNIEELSQIEAD